jgi:hypothetical protein
VSNVDNYRTFRKTLHCHLHGECVVGGRFWNTYIGQAVSGKLDLMVLIFGAEERAAVQLEISMGLRKRGDQQFLGTRVKERRRRKNQPLHINP